MMERVLDEVLDRAVSAKGSLRDLPSHVRKQALRYLGDQIRASEKELAFLIVREGVKTLREAKHEVARATETFFLASEELGQSPGEVVDFTRSTYGQGRWGFWDRRPLGIVVGITPFNDPLNLVAHKVAPAIACGAPIIIKPHPSTPSLAHWIANTASQTDLPAGSVQVLEGGAEIVSNIVSNPDVRVVSFTGGAKAGEAIAAAAVGKRLILECGGVCSSYVHHDADLEHAARCLVSGMVWAAGQNCIHTQHIFAHQAVSEPLTELLTRNILSLEVGDRLSLKTDLSRQRDTQAVHRIETLIENAIEKGAIALVRITSEDALTIGPCLLKGVSRDDPIVTEEVFGPISVLSSVDDIHSAITEVSRLGPSINTSIFSDSLKAVRLWHQNVDAGATIVNDSTDFRVDHMPFGGNGSAGLGREGVRESMQAMTEKHLLVFSEQ